MIANWMEGALILSPESDNDTQTLKALAAACPEMMWWAEPPQENKDDQRSVRARAAARLADSECSSMPNR